MEDRMGLLLVDSGRSVSGYHRVEWELAARLPRKRFEVAVWLSAAPGMDPFARALEEGGVAVERMPDVVSQWDWRGRFDIWRRLRRARPTLIHLHHAEPRSDLLPAVLIDLAGPHALVITEHVGASPAVFGRGCPTRRSLGRADIVTTVCGAVADELVRECGVERARVRVVPMGIDEPDEEMERVSARQARQRLGPGAMRPLWVSAGPLEPHKGHGVLLEALAEIHRRGLGFAAVLAGEGSCRPSLERQARDLQLAGHVHFLGSVEDRGFLLRAADAVILPSITETIPHALLESLARARPVIASAVGGIPEVVQDGVNGRLVPPGDPRALAAALETFHRHPSFAQQLGMRAAGRVREGFAWTRVVEAFEAVYDEALGLASFSPEFPRGVPVGH